MNNLNKENKVFFYFQYTTYHGYSIEMNNLKKENNVFIVLFVLCKLSAMSHGYNS